MPEKSVLKCCACGKKIGEGEINDGYVSIKCKCGAITTIQKTMPKPPEPEKKFIHNLPYQNRMDLNKK